MIGKGVQGFEIGKCTDKIAQLVQVLIIVRDAGNDNVTDPHIHMFLVQIFCESKNTVIRL